MLPLLPPLLPLPPLQPCAAALLLLAKSPNSHATTVAQRLRVTAKGRWLWSRGCTGGEGRASSSERRQAAAAARRAAGLEAAWRGPRYDGIVCSITAGALSTGEAAHTVPADHRSLAQGLHTCLVYGTQVGSLLKAVGLPAARWAASQPQHVSHSPCMRCKPPSPPPAARSGIPHASDKVGRPGRACRNG